MLRVVIAVVLGGVVLQAWGFASWMVLGMHDATFNDLGDPATEDALAALIEKADLKDSGWYYWPAMPEDWGDAEAMAAYEERHASMPIGHLIVAPAGQEPMPPSMMAIAGVTNLAIALAACLLVAMSKLKGFFKRWVFVVGLGVVTVLATDVMGWNWMRIPTDYAIAMAVDRLIAMALLGAVVAALIYPARPGKHSEPQG
ncbi:hypothetical protein [Algisphaera agarilytica]|uniref:Transmembrane protein n=1 Tax=Algisphaera agarilytica TaxID=1385975 RepID=A0A7X0LJX7_9BACT|nr:hypothetical protein [Algisphaera agarilytica]MBB6429239.1 hypothetical protein [Algisphaera agarilytica]